MKNVFAIFSLLFCSFAVVGQVKFGPAIGLNNTRYVYKGGNEYLRKDRFDVVPDFRVGVLMETRLSRSCAFQPSLVFARNSEISTDFYDHSKTVGYNLNTLELPLIFLLKPPMHGSGRIFLGGGLVPMMILGGHGRVHSYTKGVLNQSSGPITDGYNLLAAAVRGEVGYETKQGLSLQIYTQKEFTQILSVPAPRVSVLTFFNYGIGASYFFISGTSKKATQRRESRLERKKKIVRNGRRFRKREKQ
jgi:hypothetical protein